MSSDPSRLIAALARDRINLDLKTLDLCFLPGLYLRADRASLASFEENVLIDIFEQTCDVVDPGAERPRKRATHAIQRLRDQRMLARVDGAGIVRSGEYTLTRLAAAVVKYYLADEALTRESLTLASDRLTRAWPPLPKSIYSGPSHSSMPDEGMRIESATVVPVTVPIAGGAEKSKSTEMLSAVKP
jgi:chromosome condensin MukBEF complex kleisin-like MukF subunit